MRSIIKSKAVQFPLFVLGLSLFACGPALRKAELERSVNNYVTALRRGEENVMIAYVEPKKRDAFSKNVSRLEDVHLSNAEVRSIYPDEKLNKAVVTVFVEFYSQAGMSVSEEKRRLIWEYNAKEKAWLLSETTPLGNSVN